MTIAGMIVLRWEGWFYDRKFDVFDEKWNFYVIETDIRYPNQFLYKR